MKDNFTPKTRIINIPGSSFKVQLGREGGWVIRILRGLSVVSTVPIEDKTLVPNNIVEIIRDNLSGRFMPISPFQISRAVSQLLNDVEAGWTPPEEKPTTAYVGEGDAAVLSGEITTDSGTTEISEAENEIGEGIEEETADESHLEREEEEVSPKIRMPTVLTLLGLAGKEEEVEAEKEVEAEEEIKEAEEEMSELKKRLKSLKERMRERTFSDRIANNK